MYYIACIVALLGILFYCLLGPGGYRDLKKARLELQKQQERVENLRRDNQERMKTIEALRSDKEALEAYAREKGYGREGEIIQKLSK